MGCYKAGKYLCDKLTKKVADICDNNNLKDERIKKEGGIKGWKQNSGSNGKL